MTSVANTAQIAVSRCEAELTGARSSSTIGSTPGASYLEISQNRGSGHGRLVRRWEAASGGPLALSQRLPILPQEALQRTVEVRRLPHHLQPDLLREQRVTGEHEQPPAAPVLCRHLA